MLTAYPLTASLLWAWDRHGLLVGELALQDVLRTDRARVQCYGADVSVFEPGTFGLLAAMELH